MRGGSDRFGGIQRGWPLGSLLAGLPDPSREQLLKLGREREHASAGQVLIREGDSSTGVYLIVDGAVKVTGAAEGREAMLAIRVRGDLVGELAAMDSLPRVATVTTAGPVTVRVIGQAEFLGLLSRDGPLALALARGVGGKLRTATARRVDFVGCDAPGRFARVLLDLATRYGRDTPDGRTITCPLTQPELATLASVSGPTADRALRRFRADGIVVTGYREISVTDVAALRKCAYPLNPGDQEA